MLGDPARLHGLLDAARVVGPDAATRFDSGSDTWTVITADGEQLAARVIVHASASPDDVVAAHGMPNRFRIPGPHTAGKPGTSPGSSTACAAVGPAASRPARPGCGCAGICRPEGSPGSI